MRSDKYKGRFNIVLPFIKIGRAVRYEREAVNQAIKELKASKWKISPEIRARILAKHKAGATQRELQKLFNLSAGAVNKITKGITKNLKSTIAKGTEYLTELSDLNEYEREAVTQAVSDNARAIIFFKQTAIKNQIMANRLLNEASDLSDIELHSRITARNKETMLGKNYELQEQGSTSAVTQIVIRRDDIWKLTILTYFTSYRYFLTTICV